MLGLSLLQNPECCPIALTDLSCGLKERGDRGRSLLELSALNVDSSPRFCLVLYRLAVVNGVRAHTRAWNDVTVNTPIRPSVTLEDLAEQPNRVWVGGTEGGVW